MNDKEWYDETYKRMVAAQVYFKAKEWIVLMDFLETARTTE